MNWFRKNRTAIPGTPGLGAHHPRIRWWHGYPRN